MNRTCTSSKSLLRLQIVNTQGTTWLTPTLLEELYRAIEGEKTAKAVLLEGIGDSFCKGLDLEQLIGRKPLTPAPRTSDDFLGRFASLLDLIQSTARPVIALVDGAAFGGGVGLAAAADLVIATASARFGLPEALFGLIPAMVFPVIAKRMGFSKTQQLALEGNSISAQTAYSAGLVDLVTEDIERACMHAVQRYSRMEPNAIGTIKQLTWKYYASPGGYLQEATRRFYELAGSPEAQRRLAQFVAGEAPWLES